MSIEYTATVICGFKLEVEEVMKKVKKYDVDTGEPCFVSELDYKVGTVDNKKIIKRPRIYAGDLVENLEIFDFGYALSDLFLGKEVAEVLYTGHREFKTSKLCKDLTNFAAKHMLVPKFYLIMRCV